MAARRTRPESPVSRMTFRPPRPPRAFMPVYAHDALAMGAVGLPPDI